MDVLCYETKVTGPVKRETFLARWSARMRVDGRDAEPFAHVMVVCME